MSAPGSSTTPRRALGRVRTWAPVVAAAAAIVVVALVAGPGRRPGGAPLDPHGTGPLGAKALVETLRALGAQVSVTARPPEGPGTALVLGDGLSEQGRARLLAWVRSGGRLVVADQGSPLNPFPLRSAVGGGARTLDRRCDLPALREVHRVRAEPVWVLGATAGAVGCFPVGGGHWMVARPEGAGVIVVLGGPGAFVNRALGHEDNAALASALLAPRAGTRVTVVVPPPGGTGRRGLWELMAPSVKAALAQLGAAAVVAALWRGRRLGRPVIEDVPVAIDASETVAALGRLLHRAGATGRAAALLRADLHREVGDSPEHAALLAGSPPEDDAALVALARDVERARALARAGSGGPGGPVSDGPGWPGANPTTRRH